jgi:fructose/tagatose bisphosphate aldolase
MPLMTTKPMFDLAYEGGFAVGAFNVNNMEITQGIIDACAAEKSPMILQISKGARKYANMLEMKLSANGHQISEIPPGPPLTKGGWGDFRGIHP